NPASGYVDETYRYDIIGRLDTTTRDGMIIDQRRYTANSQLERTGITNEIMGMLRFSGLLREAFKAADVNTEFTMYEYESDPANTQPGLPKDRVDQVLLQQVHIASNDTRYSNTRFINDEAGRLTRYTHDNAY
ncbi:hypothetical protein ACO0LF_31660, partial [Undibacterium sp. Di27W]|uniref:hypothetical protein n=1 Tax=Undibacterium sp. Di27W TaxID=3413036 RepID=UPI003BF32E58